jgi:methionine--tRNA ligase beta chain
LFLKFPDYVFYFDVGLRIGKVLKVSPHPERDNLFVEEIDLGEEVPRTIVSGLAKYLTAEEFTGKKVVVCTNLKPSKFAGVLSQGMVLAASNQEKTVVEILEAPKGSKIGEQVMFDGFESNPDATLNPKHKVFEKVSSDFKTTDDMVATFKGISFSTSGGPVTVKSLKNASIG